MHIAYLEDLPAHQEQMLALLNCWIEERSPQSAVTVFPDAASFLFAREDQHFDLYLLDIVMPGLDGLSLAKKLRQAGDETPIIFVTAERDYVFAGYKVAAVDYLLKPIERTELWQVLERVERTLTVERPSLLLERRGEKLSVYVEQIVAVEVQDKDLIYSLWQAQTGSEQLTVRGSLQELEAELHELGFGQTFLRCHRSFLVNLAYVQKILKSELVMQDGQRIPLARNRRQELLETYLKFRQTRATERQGLK